MKPSLLLFLLLSFHLSAQERSERTDFFYMTNHLNVFGNYVGWEFGLNYVPRQNTTYRFSQN